MPDWLVSIILGLVEGLTEFIPVSSTGHLLLFEKWLGQRPDWYTVFIQVGAALALLPLFWRTLAEHLAAIREPASRDYLLKLCAAFFITGIGGLVLAKLDFQLPEEIGPVAWATLIGAFVIFGVEAWRKAHPGSTLITWTIAVTCGLAQLVAAVFPGTSRSGATIMAAIAFGLSRPAATEFSFILGMITLTAAGMFKVFEAWHDGEIQGVSATDLALGFIAAAVSAFIVVRWLLRFVQSHTFNGFAVYRLFLGLVLLFWATGY
jgi:undecaprenyl-diphosphatase